MCIRHLLYTTCKSIHGCFRWVRHRDILHRFPIDTTTAETLPFAGDVLSYGYLNEGAFDTITSEMLITEIGRGDNGYELKLVDYNPTSMLPERTRNTPNITQPDIRIYSHLFPTVTMDEDTTSVETPISITGVPLISRDRETCIAHCVLMMFIIFFIKDPQQSVQKTGKEIVTVEEDKVH